MSERSVLIISRNLPPLIGGIERLLAHTIEALEGRFKLEVWGPTGCRTYLPASVKVVELPTAVPLFLAQAYARLLSQRISASVVLAANGVVAPLARDCARRAACPYAVMVHGLDVAYPQALYRHLFLPAVASADLVIANSRFTAGLAGGIGAKRVEILNPGVRWPAAEVDAADFRGRHGWGDRPVVLSVSRLIRRKGVADFVEFILPTLVAQIPTILYSVIGGEPRASGRSVSGERERIGQAARRAGVQDHVQLLGDISDPSLDGELAAAYQAADVLAFPLQDLPGDVEGFGMVALEAASFGLPTVAFAVGGVADAVVDGRTGYLIAARDNESFAQGVLRILERQRSVYSDACHAHAASHGWDRFEGQITTLISKLARNLGGLHA